MDQERIGKFIAELRKENGMTQEELKELQETINDLIEYQSNRQNENDRKANTYGLIGSLALLLALFSNAFGYLNYIFTDNAVEFVRGSLYGICICMNMISLYNRSHKITIREKKRELIKKMSKERKDG